eukprot:TRINITY_DN10946_c0_g1_i1.p1 TRINITY_DN10946_c0_g1~~TRINITY_DN10946_c0_g1_i1.p1  ORF type:complete len:198 (-),score=5.13 TRINITY_DN10946_c0_g1_i1:22-552(-)
MANSIIASLLVSALFFSAAATASGSFFPTYAKYNDAACSTLTYLNSAPYISCDGLPPFPKAECAFDSASGLYVKNWCADSVPTITTPGVMMVYYEVQKCSNDSAISYTFEAAGSCLYSTAYSTSISYDCTNTAVTIKKCQGSGCGDSCRKSKVPLVNGVSKCSDGDIVYHCIPKSN